jgi:hypothetical protein
VDPTAKPTTTLTRKAVGRSLQTLPSSWDWRCAARIRAAAVLLAAAACTNGPAVGTRPPASAPATGEAELLQVRALIGSAACVSDADCRVAGIGDRPCGGPEDHLAWSLRVTDPEELWRAVRAHAEARRRWHEAIGLSSTCEVRPPPDVACQGQPGRCTLLPRGSALR